MRKLVYLLCFLLAAQGINAQIAHLNNASFEGEPQDATMPVGWFACTNATTPDILPGPWGVYEEPSEGNSFLGLITRGDGSNERIGQRLPSPLKKGDCYVFTIDLAHSGTYADYNQPISLRIWGGRRKCDQTQLLFESPPIEEMDWATFSVDFFVDKTLNYISLEAYYENEEEPRQGNILIDNISPIRRCVRAGRE